MSEQKKARKHRTPLRDIICMRIRDHHTASGESMKELETGTGIDRTTFLDWFAFRTAPKVENVQNVAEHFGVPERCMQCRDDDSVCGTCTPKRRTPRRTPPPPKS